LSLSILKTPLYSLLSSCSISLMRVLLNPHSFLCSIHFRTQHDGDVVFMRLAPCSAQGEQLLLSTVQFSFYFRTYFVFVFPFQKLYFIICDVMQCVILPKEIFFLISGWRGIAQRPARTGAVFDTRSSGPLERVFCV